MAHLWSLQLLQRLLHTVIPTSTHQQNWSNVTYNGDVGAKPYLPAFEPAKRLQLLIKTLGIPRCLCPSWDVS